MKLTRSDLVIEDASLDMAGILKPWNFLLKGRLRPICFSRFGDLFFERPDGSVHELDVLHVRLGRISPTVDRFRGLMEDRGWQEEHFLSLLIWQLHEQGIAPGAGQCYGVAPHPLLGGKLVRENILLMPLGAWHLVCAQLAERASRVAEM
jgi:hypothetical protein